QFFNLGFRNRRKVMEPLWGKVFDLLALDHATVANEGDRGDTKPDLDLLELRSKGVWIGGISGQHFDRDPMSVLVAESADDNLVVPFFAIAIVAKCGPFVMCPFQVATRDIVQKQAGRCGLCTLRKEPILYTCLGPSQPIEVFVQRILIKGV